MGKNVVEAVRRQHSTYSEVACLAILPSAKAVKVPHPGVPTSIGVCNADPTSETRSVTTPRRFPEVGPVLQTPMEANTAPTRVTYFGGIGGRNYWSKWNHHKRTLKVGDAVILKDDGIPRNQWNLANVSEIIEAQDGCVRRVRLTLPPGGVLLRPVPRVVLLMEKGI